MEWNCSGTGQSGVHGCIPYSGLVEDTSGSEEVEPGGRYSLIVNISAPETEVDLYTAVENQVRLSVSVEV